VDQPNDPEMPAMIEAQVQNAAPGDRIVTMPVSVPPAPGGSGA